MCIRDSDITANTDIGYDLMSSLLADRAVRCAQFQTSEAQAALILSLIHI